MGLLDQLWDETVAGPRPDSGLGRLRKYSSFSPSSSSSSSFPAPAPATAADASAPAPAPPAVTRSITIARPPSLSVDASPRAESYSSSVPSSPASTPDSPFATATTPKADGWRRFRRKTMVSDGPEPAVGPRSPTVYDWVVISSLDR
ncbi:dormancy-associated protein homolog 3-like isoform X2 [Miscanthus floridulus]|uniref:dormancy-associated protein homolog 3-like isoform X2 n=1 Tax=Miscanthus floridulus TaxID=154761 RepID=UPI00345839AA